MHMYINNLSKKENSKRNEQFHNKCSASDQENQQYEDVTTSGQGQVECERMKTQPSLMQTNKTNRLNWTTLYIWLGKANEKMSSGVRKRNSI